MAMVLFGTLFCLFVTGALSVDNVAVGSNCTTADHCIIHAVCDKVNAKCLLEADQPCKGNENNCVSGASCKTDVCGCGAAYTKHADNTCIHKTDGIVGSNCTSAPTVCTASNTECSNLKTCKCRTGFILNVTNGQCVPIHTFGTPCTPNDETKGDCADANAICSTAGTCDCKSGYTGSPGENCTGNVALGATCSPADESQANCADAHAICPAARAECTCKPGYTQSGTSCIAAGGSIPLGATCSPADESQANCADAHAICPAAGAKCTCKPGYPQSGTSCAEQRGNKGGQIAYSPLLVFLAPVSLAVFMGQ